MGWEILSILAVFISALLSTLLLMLSRFFDFKMLEQSAKAELVFAASSLFVVIMLIATVQFGANVGMNIAKEMYVYTYNNQYLHYTEIDPVTNQPTPKELDLSFFDANRYSLIDIMILYMRSVMYCTEDIGIWLYRISMILHWGSSITQDVFMSFPMSGWSFGGLAQTTDNFLNIIYFMELINFLQIYILRFVDAFALVLIPVGIVLRAFPPTRGAGAYIIAVSIGLYLVYPLAYLFVVFSSPYPNLCATPQIPEPVGIGENSKAGLGSQLVLWMRAFQNDILDLFNKTSDLINALLINLCFFPFLALAIAMTFIQFSTGLFGANIPEIGRGLMKLI
ncbi:MAG: hypothetical protein ACOZBG_04710 [Candidatus Micrarchaeota archaeon]